MFEMKHIRDLRVDEYCFIFSDEDLKRLQFENTRYKLKDIITTSIFHHVNKNKIDKNIKSPILDVYFSPLGVNILIDIDYVTNETLSKINWELKEYLEFSQNSSNCEDDYTITLHLSKSFYLNENSKPELKCVVSSITPQIQRC